MYVKTATVSSGIFVVLQHTGSQQKSICLQCCVPFGPPTFFITFSADDHHWKDLMVVLANCSGRNLTEEQVDQLTDEERRDFMASNPVVTARHFAHHFQCLVKEVIKGSGKPIGEVIDFF